MLKTEIRTAAGVCPAYTAQPQGAAPWPAVLMFMDGIGIRPALLEMATRLATYGYYVLLPDLYYRAGAYEPMNAHTVFSDPQARGVLREKFFSVATPAHVMADMPAFLDFLARQPEVRPGGIASTGYCMGGCLSLIAAGTFPQRVVAAASYHGGQLATDAPDSPHRLASRMRARIYVAGAIEDASFPDDMKARLEQALRAAGVEHLIETYEARHGWVPSDTPVHDAAATERHWQSLRELLRARLG
jgi:carboxymethylenebutenolidase